tara:strand:+ start:9 stop:896 length:888 start_codon:yes stop_codon:yes gene_type:complete
MEQIDHTILLDMLRITMLIYNYGKNIDPIVEEDGENGEDTQIENVESFVSSLKKSGEFDKIDINDVRKQALSEIVNNVPSATLCCFINSNITDVQAGITISKGKKRICVCFRGSESRKDWYYDLMIVKCKLQDNIYVHSGFYSQLIGDGTYDKIKNCVIELLKTYPDYELYVCGHSLGGSLSTLFGFMFSHETDKNITVCSFASPRVGNSEWKKQFEKKSNLTHYRITNKRDIVTALPIYKYHHVGHNIQLCENKVKEYDCITKRSCFDETIVKCFSILEHNCELYYKRLQDNKW